MTPHLVADPWVDAADRAELFLGEVEFTLKSMIGAFCENEREHMASLFVEDPCPLDLSKRPGCARRLTEDEAVESAVDEMMDALHHALSEPRRLRLCE